LVAGNFGARTGFLIAIKETSNNLTEKCFVISEGWTQHDLPSIEFSDFIKLWAHQKGQASILVRLCV